eukprot:NODE_3837_length_875_cov_4.165860_g3189_i0.p3 GENE.NODE_3837_length_875_cov_4.165860_g3189_i0~~NODE_3837_length_875_cov_4.165860_g3189_i0.p3  ORF type:complete len:62 (-),score=0.79 NODE_3837_length_875_cov_4.165860_g3189_i0:320-505(-)
MTYGHAWSGPDGPDQGPKRCKRHLLGKGPGYARAYAELTLRMHTRPSGPRGWPAEGRPEDL